ncbi:MAG: glutathione S-transferase domain-containing protein [Pseudomonadota bacterium]
MKARKQFGFVRFSKIQEIIDKSRDAMCDHLDALDRHLASNGPWIAGDTFTFADASWMVLLDRLEEADWSDYFWGAAMRARLRDYWEQCKARPSYQEQVAQKRCPITRNGIRDVAAEKSSNPEYRRVLEHGPGVAV